MLVCKSFSYVESDTIYNTCMGINIINNDIIFSY